jgi:hypothetical protein
MKANRVHRFGAPDVILFEEIARPVPGADEILVRSRPASCWWATTSCPTGAMGRSGVGAAKGPSASQVVRFFDPRFPPSFSSIAATTKCMRTMSCVTQCSLRRR